MWIAMYFIAFTASTETDKNICKAIIAQSHVWVLNKGHKNNFKETTIVLSQT